MSQVLNTGVFGTTEFDAWPLINQEIAPDVIRGITEGSAALSMFKRLPNMSARTLRMPVLDTLGGAQFVETTVDDDLIAGADVQVNDEEMETPSSYQKYPPMTEFPELKKTHQMKWANVFIHAEAIAIILPIPEDVLDDMSYDFWAEVTPRIVEAFHQRIDHAIIWGQGRPTSWPTGIVPTAINRGYVVPRGTGVDLAGDISAVMGLLEADGRNPSGFMVDPTLKMELRDLRDNQNRPIFNDPLTAGTPASLFGLPINYVWNNTFRPNVSPLIAGVMDEARYSIRSDFRYKLITEGVITDEDQNIVFNLPQQDMVALRIVMRLGWAVPNPIHKMAADRSASWPFAILGGTT